MLTALQNAGHIVTTYEWGDLEFPGVIEQDWVIHLGAITSTTERDVDKIMTQNYDFSRMLFDSCKTYGVNLQYASSASIYGLCTDFREDAPVDPRTPYAWSKYLFERYHTGHQGGNIVQGFRYFNVYGPDGEAHKGSQASPYYQFEKQAKQTRLIKVFENSNSYHRDFIHVSKVIEYHLKFLECKSSGIFNIGTGETKSFLDVAIEIANKNNSDIEFVRMPEILKSSYQEYTCANMDKTNNIIQNET